MPSTTSRIPWVLLGGIICFGFAYTQSPLFFSNQHQYFLHGLAAGGDGNLDRDWLANTLDPTPAFSAFVEFTFRHVDLFCVHLVFAALLGLYFVSLLAIASAIVPESPGRNRTLAVIGAMLVVIHAALGRWLSVRVLGVDYPWFLQSGLAGQYLLGPGLQPSAFGILLVASLAAFVHDRLVLAVACSSAACLMHATYLFPAAMLTASYMAALWQNGRGRAALLVGLGSLLAVSPAVIYSALTFAPTSPEIFQEAQRILALVRIPHHTVVRRWFDVIAGLQLAWIVFAVLLARHSPLFLPLTLVFMLGLALSLLQYVTGSLFLSLLFPWRISTLLVPVATAIIVTRLSMILPDARRAAAAGWGAATLAAVAGGIYIQVEGLGYGANEQELPALNFVRDHKERDDVYLIPVRMPTPSGARGVFSMTFTPPPRSKDKDAIAVDLQRFRLYTGAPIYVDFKSMPYKDTDVLEWLRRMRQCQEWYAQNDWNSPQVRQQLRREGITRIVIPAAKPIAGDDYELLYSDPYYRLYRLKLESAQR